MSLNHKTHIRGSERRRKRTIMPIAYFVAEVIFLWLVLALIQVDFNILVWNFWAIIIFILGIAYSVLKTLNIYERQKDYLTEDEYQKLK